MERSRCSRAFTLVELLVVIGILALLISIILPSMARARQLARRAGCTANLHAIGRAVHLYANQNQTLLPSYVDSADDNNHVGLHRKEEVGPGPTMNPGPAGSVTRAWYLLVRGAMCEITAFRCPADRSISGEYPYEFSGDNPQGEPYSIRNDWDFPVADGYVPLSYSLLPTKVSSPADYQYSLTDKGSLIVAGDANPLTQWVRPITAADTRTVSSDSDFAANSHNHRQQGQVLLSLDGHTSWETTPLCGMNITYPDGTSHPDNIWTRATDSDPLLGDLTLDERPNGPEDSLLMP